MGMFARCLHFTIRASQPCSLPGILYVFQHGDERKGSDVSCVAGDPRRFLGFRWNVCLGAILDFGRGETEKERKSDGGERSGVFPPRLRTESNGKSFYPRIWFLLTYGIRRHQTSDSSGLTIHTTKSDVLFLGRITCVWKGTNSLGPILAYFWAFPETSDESRWMVSSFPLSLFGVASFVPYFFVLFAFTFSYNLLVHWSAMMDACRPRPEVP